jgi:hypothetical protein
MGRGGNPNQSIGKAGERADLSNVASIACRPRPEVDGLVGAVVSITESALPTAVTAQLGPLL